MIVVSTTTIILLIIAIFALDLFVTQWIFKFMFSYEIRDRDILVRLFHFLPIYKIPYEKIVKMHVAPVWEVAIIPGMHFFTRPFAKRVVIEQRNRWFIYAFLTPSDPDVFITEVKKRMSNS